MKKVNQDPRRNSSIDSKRKSDSVVPIPLKKSSDSIKEKDTTKISKPPVKKLNNSIENALADMEVDFLCDRTVEFMGSGEMRNIVSVELAEQSIYFERLLCYHQKQGVISLPEFLNTEFVNILEYIRTGKATITESNIYNLFIAADFLLLSNLKKECSKFLATVITNPSEAIKIWITCRDLHWPELGDMALDKILEDFESAYKTDEFLQLKFEDVKYILMNDELNCRQERNVIDAVSLWYNYDKAQRHQYIDDLGLCIRIGLLPEGDHDYYKTSSLANSSPFIGAILEAWPTCLLDTSSELLTKHSLQLVTPRVSNEVVMVFGGWCDGEGPRATAQVYDPKSNQWNLWSPESPEHNPLGQIPRRVYAGCVIVDKCVYLVGGFDGTMALKTTLCYNFELDSGWYEISCMYEKRYYVSVTSTNDFVYALGGHNGENHGRLNTAERYNIAENLWNTISPMNRVRSDAAAAELNGHVYICGGFDGRQYHATSEFYSAETNQWTLINPMISPRGGVTLASHNGFLYAIGGNDGTSRLRMIERYDPTQECWETVGNMIRRKSNLSCSVVKDDIYIIGGWSDEPDSGILDIVEKFNTQTLQCETVHQLCFPASATCACTLTGKHLIVKYIRQETENRLLMPKFFNEDQSSVPVDPNQSSTTLVTSNTSGTAPSSRPPVRSLQTLPHGPDGNNQGTNSFPPANLSQGPLTLTNLNNILNNVRRHSTERQ